MVNRRGIGSFNGASVNSNPSALVVAELVDDLKVCGFGGGVSLINYGILESLNSWLWLLHEENSPQQHVSLVGQDSHLQGRKQLRRQSQQQS